MITPSDSFSTIDLGLLRYFTSDGRAKRLYKESKGECKFVPTGFAYNSGSNTEFLEVEQLRSLISLHVDSSFVPL